MTWTQGEFTGDGTVDINDLTIVLAHYNQTAGSAAGGLPPCPSRARWPCWPRVWLDWWPTPGGKGSNDNDSLPSGRAGRG